MSPAFGVNPDPDAGTLKAAISELHGNEASVANLIDAAPYFETSEDEAREIAADMAEVINTHWRRDGSRLGMTASDLRAIAPAMESPQIKKALLLRQTMIAVPDASPVA